MHAYGYDDDDGEMDGWMHGDVRAMFSKDFLEPSTRHACRCRQGNKAGQGRAAAEIDDRVAIINALIDRMLPACLPASLLLEINKIN